MSMTRERRRGRRGGRKVEAEKGEITSIFDDCSDGLREVSSISGRGAGGARRMRS